MYTYTRNNGNCDQVVQLMIDSYTTFLQFYSVCFYGVPWLSYLVFLDVAHARKISVYTL